MTRVVMLSGPPAASPLRFESTTTPSHGIKKIGAYFVHVVEEFVFLTESSGPFIFSGMCAMSFTHNTCGGSFVRLLLFSQERMKNVRNAYQIAFGAVNGECSVWARSGQHRVTVDL